MREFQKISLDIDAKVYTNLKEDSFRRRVTMTSIIRQMLKEKYGEQTNDSRV